MTIPTNIIKLVERFDNNLEAYKQGKYNETQIRREFIDPFFEELGWDIANTQGYAEAYKDVVHEDSIKVGKATKAPDYGFRIGGVRKFFLEAKKPSVNIKVDTHPAYQLRRYAWSAKLPLSILTDFEELAVYDCRTKPLKTDKSSHSRIFYMTYKEYAERWEGIKDIFSREAILKGSFDKYVESKKAKRGTTEVDAAFLQEIERWRELLARNIALRNPDLSQRELNFAVQCTIDRIIFLRICEDRSIEPYGKLMALKNSDNVYKKLFQLFLNADDKYNSGLFHFKEEKGRIDTHDSLTPDLAIDDKTVKDIIDNLYYPDSPYEFSVLPADILGQVYEQFLGKVIRLTSAHRAIVEEKPEVKKAGGIYYTPTYIVDYIVKQTVGKLVDGKKPGPQGGVSKFRVIDPACGSGSFLLGAYQFLLDWHLDQYVNDNPNKWAKGRTPRLYQGTGGDWRLTTDERKRILLNNIYGVDIDHQAVEVTKLSLLLKVLEGENEQTLNRQLMLFQERVLPDLHNNIKCGNSLIGPDFYHGQQMTLLNEDEMFCINVFDWKAEFPEILKNGGFDAVIGNPPYVDIKSLPEENVKYIFEKYNFANNRINLFATFIEKIFMLVKNDSFYYSMIVPTSLLAQGSYKELRKWILNNSLISTIVRLPNELFGNTIGDVKVDTMIFVFTKKQEKMNKTNIIGYSGYNRINKIDRNSANFSSQIDQERWNNNDFVWLISTDNLQVEILDKCIKETRPLEEIVEFSLGVTPYDKYKGHTTDQIKNKVFHADYKKDDTFKRLLAGNDVRRYFVKWNEKQWISYGKWLGAPRKQKFFTEKRILVKQIIDWTSKQIWASITEYELCNTQNAFNLLKDSEYELEYILGILNSKLMIFYHRKKYLDEFKMRFQKILIKDCKKFPIRTIDFSNPAEKAPHDRMVSLVAQMLDLHKQFESAKLPQKKTVLKRQIDTTDRQIDELVYELYDLTEGEIKIVESGS
jgi:type I restriction-modification system DNA methylase subunit/predicted type IV restriction endonuclease